MLPSILGPEMAAPILWASGKIAFFLQENAMPIKFLVLGGGVFGFFWGGKCRFYFYRSEDSSRKGPPFHGLRSSREIKMQNGSCQMGGREVTRWYNCFFCRKWVVAKLEGDKSASQSSILRILDVLNSVQTRCMIKEEAKNRPLFWRFSGGFWFSQERLLSRNSVRKPSKLNKIANFYKHPL